MHKQYNMNILIIINKHNRKWNIMDLWYNLVIISCGSV